MKRHSRRDVLKELGMGAAMLSSAAGSALPEDAQAETPSVEANGISDPAALMAIAAHPGDAVFTMGAAVARQVSAGGRGIFFSLTHGERGNPAIAPPEYGAMQVTATENAAKLLGAESIFFLPGWATSRQRRSALGRL